MNQPRNPSSPWRLALVVAPCLALTACASLGSVSITQVPTDRSHPIQAESHDWTVFGLAGDNDYADEVPKQLAQQCPTGKITGLMTKSESKLWIIVARRRVTAHGFCVAGSAAPPPPAVMSAIVPPLPPAPPVSPPGVP